MNNQLEYIFIVSLLNVQNVKLTFWGNKKHLLKASAQQANTHLIDSACGSFEERGQVTYFESVVPSRTVAQIGKY